MTPRPDDHDDLAWLAFCYLAGELDAASIAAFEARLDHDQAAREAVAAAVELASAVARVGVTPAPLGRPRRVRLAATALALAASLLVAVVVLRPWAGHTGPSPVAVVVKTPDVDPQTGLALAWSGLRQAATDPDEDPAVTHADAVVAWLSEPPAVDHPAADDPDDPEGPPAWMLEAASLHAGTQPSGPGL